VTTVRASSSPTRPGGGVIQAARGQERAISEGMECAQKPEQERPGVDAQECGRTAERVPELR